MFIGLDVGGTNTDAVLLNTAHDVIRSCKSPTTHDDIGKGVIRALQELLNGQSPADVSRVCVSSTLALNALLTNRYDPTGLIVVPGPGLAPPSNWNTPLTCILSGAQNHLGSIIARPDKQKVQTALLSLRDQGIKALAIVCKFSPKNPALEEWIQSLALSVFSSDIPIVLGSALSGTLNFPRRVETAWCQAALTNINTRFIARVEDALIQLNLRCPLDILKADGGTFPHSIAARNPANSIGSGPAASILGALAEAQPERDSAIISIGGTTTDIAILAAGQPLFLKEGLTVNGKGTLIKGMHTHSIALGGDSPLALSQGELVIRPERLGPAICLSPHDLDKRPPTVTDALRVLDLHQAGEKSVARQALQPLADELGCTPEETAQQALDNVLQTLKETLDSFAGSLNNQPVYTIREIQYTVPIRPEHVILIGAPAPALSKALEETLGFTVSAPANAAIANAVGASLARPTVDAELYADTSTGIMSIAPYGITKTIGKQYGITEAKTDLTTVLAEALAAACAQYGSAPGIFSHLATSPAPPGPCSHSGTCCDEPWASSIHILFAETFHTLSDTGDRGKILRLKAQVSPGIITNGGQST